MTQRADRGKALLFHDRGTRRGWVVSSTPRPHFTPPEKTWYPFYKRLGGPQGQSGRAENLASTGIRFRTVQPVVSHYTDWATQPTIIIIIIQLSWTWYHVAGILKAEQDECGTIPHNYGSCLPYYMLPFPRGQQPSQPVLWEHHTSGMGYTQGIYNSSGHIILTNKEIYASVKKPYYNRDNKFK